MHEQIENEYIIGLLQQRSQTIYNVHSDNKLSEMLSLFEKGLENVKVSHRNWHVVILKFLLATLISDIIYGKIFIWDG